MLNLLRKSAARKEFAALLESQLVARARAPFFFRDLEVPDTIDGRFDMVTLHGWLVLERLKIAGMDAEAQALTDSLFISFDEALREQGTGDMGMPLGVQLVGLRHEDDRLLSTAAWVAAHLD